MKKKYDNNNNNNSKCIYIYIYTYVYTHTSTSGVEKSSAHRGGGSVPNQPSGPVVCGSALNELSQHA